MKLSLTLDTNGLFLRDEDDRARNALFIDLFEQYKKDYLQYGASDEVVYTLVNPFTVLRPTIGIAALPENEEDYDEVQECLERLSRFQEDFGYSLEKPATFWGSALFDGGTICADWVEIGGEHYILFA